MTEYSGTITTGGTAQPITPAGGNPLRRRLLYQNNSTGDLYFMATNGASAGNGVGLCVPGGQHQIFQWNGHHLMAEGNGNNTRNIGAEWPDIAVPNGQVTVWGASTSQAFYVEEA